MISSVSAPVPITLEVIVPAEQKPRILASPSHHSLKRQSHMPPEHHTSQCNNSHIDHDSFDKAEHSSLVSIRHRNNPIPRCGFIGLLVRKVRKVRLELSKQPGGETDAKDTGCEGSEGRDESQLHEVKRSCAWGRCQAGSGFWPGYLPTRAKMVGVKDAMLVPLCMPAATSEGRLSRTQPTSAGHWSNSNPRGSELLACR